MWGTHELSRVKFPFLYCQFRFFKTNEGKIIFKNVTMKTPCIINPIHAKDF